MYLSKGYIAKTTYKATIDEFNTTKQAPYLAEPLSFKG
jgi:hypothetical protein